MTEEFITFLRASSRWVVFTLAGGESGLPYLEHARLSYSVIAQQPEIYLKNK